MYQNPMIYVEHSPQAYLLFRIESKEILMGNKLARSFFMKNLTFPSLETLFLSNEETISVENIREKLKTTDMIQAWNLVAVKHTGERFLCDLEMRTYSQEEGLFYVVITPKLEEKALYMKDWVDNAAKPIFILSLAEELSITYANPRFYEFFGTTEDEFGEKYQHSMAPLLAPETREEFMENYLALRENSTEFDMDVLFLWEDDPDDCSLYHVIGQKISISDNVPSVFVEVVDIVRRREIMEKYQELSDYFEIMQDLTKDVLFRVEIDNKTLLHRQDRASIFDIPAKVVNFPEAMRHTDAIHPEDLESYMEYAKKMMDGVGGQHRVRIKMSNGNYETYRMISRPVHNLRGKAIGIMGKLTNIQQVVDLEKKANHDFMTEVLNKGAFQERVSQILSQSFPDEKHAFLFLDLDDFKGINDKLGHTFGDFLLTTVAKRLKNLIREQDLVGRVGGDEFVVFLKNIYSEDSVLERAQSVLQSLRREFGYEGKRASVKASLGIAIFPEQGKSYEELYKNSDKAMYSSKEHGKDKVSFYREDSQ